MLCFTTMLAVRHLSASTLAYKSDKEEVDCDIKTEKCAPVRYDACALLGFGGERRVCTLFRIGNAQESFTSGNNGHHVNTR